MVVYNYEFEFDADKKKIMNLIKAAIILVKCAIYIYKSK